MATLISDVTHDRDHVSKKIGELINSVNSTTQEDIKTIFKEVASGAMVDSIATTTSSLIDYSPLQMGSIAVLCASVAHDYMCDVALISPKNMLLLMGAILVNRKHIMRICEFAMGLFAKSRTVVTQMANPAVDFMGAMCVGLYALIYPGRKPVSASLWEKTMDYSKAKRSFRDMFETIIDLLQWIVDALVPSDKIPLWLKTCNVHDKEVVDLLTEVDAFTRRYFDNSVVVCRSEGDKIFDLNKRLKKYYSGLTISHHNTTLRDLIRSEIGRLDKILDKFRIASYTDDGKRVEPVSLVIASVPGNFKSQVTERIIADWNKALLTDAEYREVLIDSNRWTYFRYEEEKYMDGFTTDAKVIVYDDLNQFLIDPFNPDNAHANIMRMYGDWPYRVHKADVDSKGNTYFKCNLIVATTNIPVPIVESLRDQEAFSRRIDFAVYQTPKDEFCTKDTINLDPYQHKLDFNNPNLPKGPLGLVSTDPNLLFDYVLYDPRSGAIKERVSYSTLISRMVDLHKRKLMYCDQKNLEIQEVLRARIPGLETQMGFSWDDLEDDNLDDTKFNLKIQCKKTDKLVTAYYSDKLEKTIASEKLEIAIELYEKLLKSAGYHLSLEMIEQSFFFVIPSVYGNGSFKHIIQDPELFMDKCSDTALISEHRNVVWEMEVETTTERPSSLLETLQTYWAVFAETFKTTYYRFTKSALDFLSNDVNVSMIVLGFGLYTTSKCFNVVKNYLAPDTSREDVSSDEEENFLSLHSDTTNEVPPKSSKKRPHKKNKGHKKLYKYAIEDTVYHEMGQVMDPNGYNIANAIVKDSVFVMSVKEKPESDIYKRLGCITVIRDNIAICNRHFVQFLRQSVESNPSFTRAPIKFFKQGSSAEGSLEFFTTVGDFIATDSIFENTRLSSQDIILCKVPTGMRRFKDITRFLGTREDAAKVRDKEGYLYGYDGNAYFKNMVTCKLSKNIVAASKDSKTGETYVDVAYEYHAFTEPGDCGTPLFFFNKFAATAKLFGIHYAGAPSIGVGYSTAIFKEDIISALVDFNSPVILMKDQTVRLQSNATFSNGQFDRLYDTEIVVATNGKSKLVKSPFYGGWGAATMKPAHMVPFKNTEGEIIDPMELCLAKYCTQNILIDSELIKLVADSYYLDILRSSSKNVEKKVLTFEEAVVGIEGDEDYLAIPRGTSPGYPYITDPAIRKCPGKTYWFGTGDEYDMDNERVEELKKAVLSQESDARKGIRTEYLFVDCLKDAKDVIEKVEKGKTRMFSSGPLDYLILVRMYFGAFTSWYKKNRIFNGSAIGANPFGEEWDVLARQLLKFGDSSQKNIGAGDYSAYDGSEKVEVHMEILRIINRWYDDGPTNKLVREVLWADVYNSVHISPKRFVYTWVSSLPSGHALTSIINTMYNGIAYRYCFFRATGNSLVELSNFQDHVYLCALGDDSVYSTSPEYIDVFSEDKLGVFMAELGLTYTPEHKGAADLFRRDITQVNFLKRSFRFEPLANRYVAPLDKRVIRETPYWTKEKGFMTITKTNVNTSLWEMALHGPKAFDEFFDEVIKADVNVDFVPNVSSWKIALEYAINLDYYY
jgi:hypothetical protein